MNTAVINAPMIDVLLKQWYCDTGCFLKNLTGPFTCLVSSSFYVLVMCPSYLTICMYIPVVLGLQ